MGVSDWRPNKAVKIRGIQKATVVAVVAEDIAVFNSPVKDMVDFVRCQNCFTRAGHMKIVTLITYGSQRIGVASVPPGRWNKKVE